jgi:hypothetical protein
MATSNPPAVVPAFQGGIVVLNHSALQLEVSNSAPGCTAFGNTRGCRADLQLRLWKRPICGIATAERAAALAPNGDSDFGGPA